MLTFVLLWKPFQHVLIIINCIFLFFLNSDLRIVSGENVIIDYVPYQVSINKIDFASWDLFKISKIFTHYCGGTIVASKYILTAGHCVFNIAGQFEVRAGADISNDGGVLYEIEKMMLHPDFKHSPRMHDMALLEMSDDIQFTDRINKIPMVDENFILSENKTVETSGYGRLCMNCTSRINLYSIKLTTLTNEQCYRVFGNLDKNFTMCAIDLAKGKTSKINE